MRMQNQSLRYPAILGWDSVLRFILDIVHNPMLVVETGHPLSELALWAEQVRGWPHGVLVADHLPHRNLEGFALTSSAKGFFFPKSLTRDDLQDKWPGQVIELPETPLIPVVAHQPPAPAARKADTTRVLLVAYYAGPSQMVGVQRPNYWFEELENLTDGDVTVDLVTAVQWPDSPPQVHHVPDLGSASVTTSRPLDAWTMNAFELTVANGQSFTQVAAFWAFSLQRYFEQRRDEYDVVIITGNPYAYFEFARYAKRRWYAATILDYRDPFAMNPRASFNDAALAVARHVETGWNHMADVVTAVNEKCAEWVQGDPELRVEVVRNGFDERAGLTELPAIRETGPIRFAHAGQFYGISRPENLLNALAGTDAEFHQMGPTLAGTTSGLCNHGMVPRGALGELLALMDCGVTFSSELGFETPTKVFDYLAAGLDVLVLYAGDWERSALARMLDGVDGVHWVRNDEAAIGQFLAEYQAPERHVDPERRMRFSRRASTLRLAELIRELGDHSFTPANPGLHD